MMFQLLVLILKSPNVLCRFAETVFVAESSGKNLADLENSRCDLKKKDYILSRVLQIKFEA